MQCRMSQKIGNLLEAYNNLVNIYDNPVEDLCKHPKCLNL
jgi:hypothetical protein